MNWFMFLIFSLFLFSASPKKANAQMMMPMGGNVSQQVYNYTAQEEIEGQTIYSNLTSGQVNADQFTNEDLGKIGEYFMGRMVGNTQRHAFMNQMMTNMMGENGEEAIHINLGRRYMDRLTNTTSSNMMSGCRVDK